jgi:glutathione S-transferase
MASKKNKNTKKHTSGDKIYIMKGSSPCRLVWWIAMLADYRADIIDIDLMKGENKESWFVEMNPRQCVPFYRSKEGVTLTESRAISKYLISKTYRSDLSKKYPGIWNTFSNVKRAKVDEMLDYDLGTLYKRISDFIYPIVFRGEKPDRDKYQLIKKSVVYLNDKIIENNGFLCCDNVSLADLSVSLSLTMLDFFEQEDFNLDAGKEYIEWQIKMKELPHWEDINKDFYKWLESKIGKQ